MRQLAFVGLVSLWCGVDSAGGLDRLQGTWEIVALVEKGKAIPSNELKTLEVVITGERLKINSGGKTVSDYQVKLDEQPWTIDMTLTDGPDKGKVAPGIYALEGDTLHIGVDEDFKNRPASFDEKDTKTCSVITLIRRKKE
jgi:uncharacterized protein (TIGR03067 family)